MPTSENHLHLAQLARSVKTRLESALQLPFDVLVRTGDRFLATDSATHSWNEGDDCRLPLTVEYLGSLYQSKLIAKDERNEYLIVPISESCQTRCIVVGTIERCHSRIARELADSIVESCSQKRELISARARIDECIQQITTNFEELAWLRKLAEHFEISEAKNSISQIVTSTLPTLREVIHAESIFLFRSNNNEDEPYKAGTFELVFRDGLANISEQQAEEIVRHLECGNSGHTIVRNSQTASQSIADIPAAKHCIVAKIFNRARLAGWILVVNKMPLLSMDPWYSQVESRSEFEFGTSEAGLVSSIAAMLGAYFHNLELFNDKEDLLVGVIRTLVNSIDAKDKYTCGHSDRVASMSRRIAKQLGMSEQECDQIHLSGMLHDIGKIGVPDYVLSKPGNLSDSEFALIKLHPVIGYEILKELKLISYVLPGVLSHHEAMDGSGYPHKLKGEAIPLYGRIIAVADSYDAMTSDRPYRKGMPSAKAEKIISEGSGTQWDPVIVQAFLNAIDDIYEICGTGPKQIAASSEANGAAKNSTLPSISIANWGIGGLEQGASQS